MKSIAKFANMIPLRYASYRGLATSAVRDASKMQCQTKFASRRSRYLFWAGVVTGLSAATTVVLCRPLDTPDYLLPYYLRDVRSRFAHYASIKKKSGARFMTAEDFVCALLGSKETKLEDSGAANDLADLFAATDANGDGKLSFVEFNFLMLLLTVKPRDLQLAFTVFDEEGKGSLTLDQFTRVVAALSDDNGSALKKLSKGGILRRLFGEEGTRTCTCAELQATIDVLQQEVWKAEFIQFDKKRRGFISSEQFGQLIASQMIGSHLPFFLVENLRKLGDTNDTVPFESWIAFHKIMSRADDISEAVELYTASGAPLLKRDFTHAITSAGLKPLQPAEVDLLFALFDRNGDGSLEYDEFFSIMKSKISFHTRAKPREKVNIFQRFLDCGAEALADYV